MNTDQVLLEIAQLLDGQYFKDVPPAEFKQRLNRFIGQPREWRSYGSYFHYFIAPPAIKTDTVQTFKDDLPQICDEKIKEAQVFMDQDDCFIWEEIAIKKWIVYWYRVKRMAENRPIEGMIELDIERAKSVPFSTFLGAGRVSGGKEVHLCPFHNERTPSFTVFASGYAKCFGCSWTGDVIAYVMEKESLKFPQAVRRLCEQF